MVISFKRRRGQSTNPRLYLETLLITKRMFPQPIFYSPNDQLNSIFEFSGDTRMYPCISWCNAEQKSVQ